MGTSFAPQKPAAVKTGMLQVASSFTARPLGKALGTYLAGAGIADSVGFVEYGQVPEYMFGPASDAEHILGTLVLIRIEDALRNELKNGVTVAEITAKVRQQLTAQVNDMVAQITTLAKRGKPVWVLPCPSNGWVAESYNLVPLCRTYTNLLVARLRGTANLTLFSWPGSLASAEFDDRNTDRLGQIPFTREAFEHLGQFLGPEIEAGLLEQASKSRPSSDGNADLAKFLSELGVRVRMAVAQSGERAHVDRLLRTAAAFSLTGEKRDLSEAEVDRLLQRGCLLISVSDKLSTYGPSGVASFSTESDSLVVEDLALSCPVLGKQAEFAVLSGLAQIADSQGCSRIVFRYQASGRNQMMFKFLESIADPVEGAGFTLAASEANERIRNTAISPGTWTLELGT